MLAGSDVLMRANLPTLSSLEELVSLAKRPSLLFVRYSSGPEEDRGTKSTDYESGLELPGLSVNPLQPEAWWTRPLEHWIARQLCAYAHLGEDEDKVPWVLSGDVVGRGPDNEPLIGQFEALAYLSSSLVNEARGVYETTFDADRGKA
jgi:Family of unknown function (DUF6098)